MHDSHIKTGLTGVDWSCYQQEYANAWSESGTHYHGQSLPNVLGANLDSQLAQKQFPVDKQLGSGPFGLDGASPEMMCGNMSEQLPGSRGASALLFVWDVPRRAQIKEGGAQSS